MPLRRSSFFLSVLLVLPRIGHPQTTAPNVEELVKSYLAARGGYEKIKAVQTLRSTVKVQSLTADNKVVEEYKFTQERKRPDKLRIEYSDQWHSTIHAGDSTHAWGLESGGKVRPLKRDEMDAFLAEVDMDGDLLDYQPKGTRIEYANTRTVDGAPCYELKVVRTRGPVKYLCIGASDHLVVAARPENNAWYSIYSDFREYGGLLFAARQDIASPHTHMRYLLQSMELDVPIDDARFQPPGAADVQQAAKTSDQFRPAKVTHFDRDDMAGLAIGNGVNYVGRVTLQDGDQKYVASYRVRYIGHHPEEFKNGEDVTYRVKGDEVTIERAGGKELKARLCVLMGETPVCRD